MSKVLAGQAMLFRAKDNGNAAAALQFLLDERPQRRQRYGQLLWLAIGERACARHQRAIRHGLCKGRRLPRAGQQFGRSNGGLCLAPVRRVRRNHGKLRKAKVGHGARGRPDIQRVARRDEDNFDPVALVLGQQKMIVEPPAAAGRGSAALSGREWSRLKEALAGPK